MGEEVIHVCGTDDHGVALEIAAEKYGKSVSELVSEYRTSYKEGMEKMGIEFSIFHGTDTKQHEVIAHDFFRKLYNQNLLEERVIKQMYCNTDKMFLPDRYIVWTCPKCKTPGANGDQCEACGSMIDPETLIDPTCKTCKGNNLELKESKHLFFLLDKFQDSLKIRLETKTDRKANVMSTSLGKWIKDSLQPRCYTRDIKCGISVPLEGFEEKTIYVWFEAPLGYISITKKYFDDLGKPELFEQYWNDPETQLIEFIGKDNIVFHTIIWPALLMAYNEGMTEKGYILPANVPANEFLNLEGKKFSTSRGWAVWLDDIVANYNPDYIRFYLTCVIPETQDSDFKWKEFQDKCNNLCDSLGNLSSRVLNLSMKYCDGQFDSFDTIDRYFEWVDNQTISQVQSFVWQCLTHRDSILTHLAKFEFRDGLLELMELFALANKFVNDTKPWEIGKENPELTKKILAVLGWYLVLVGVIMRPYLPFTSQIILHTLIEDQELDAQTIGDRFDARNYKKMTEKPEHLFVKITDEQIEEEMAKLNN